MCSGIVGVRTLQDIGDLVVEDEGVNEAEEMKWNRRPLLGDFQNVVQLENFAPLKAKRFIILSNICHHNLFTSIKGLCVDGR